MHDRSCALLRGCLKPVVFRLTVSHYTGSSPTMVQSAHNDDSQACSHCYCPKCCSNEQESTSGRECTQVTTATTPSTAVSTACDKLQRIAILNGWLAIGVLDCPPFSPRTPPSQSTFTIYNGLAASTWRQSLKKLGISGQALPYQAGRYQPCRSVLRPPCTFQSSSA